MEFILPETLNGKISNERGLVTRQKCHTNALNENKMEFYNN